jgi:hypothetical protein
MLLFVGLLADLLSQIARLVAVPAGLQALVVGWLVDLLAR